MAGFRAQAPVGYRSFPVYVFLDGELFWRQRASKFPMKDLAAQDIIAVTVSYRTNVFGKHQPPDAVPCRQPMLYAICVMVVLA